MKSVFTRVILILAVCPFYVVRAQPDSTEKYEFSHGTMGSLFHIICYADDSSRAANAAIKAFARLDTLNLIMSDYLPYSELSSLTEKAGSGEWVRVSKPLFDILQTSYRWSEWSHGAFDVTIGPLTKLWRRAGRKEVFPTEEQIDKALESVGYKYLLLDPAAQSVKLEKPGMMLDLGGIAKGYAVDEVHRIFREMNIPVVMIDGAGDIMTGRKPPGQEGWKIALESLKDKEPVFILSNQAVATSGDLYRYTIFNGVRYSHIIDPETGYGITIPRTVTVFASNCTAADVLASILSVMGPKKGLKKLGNLENTEALIIEDRNGATREWKAGELGIN